MNQRVGSMRWPVTAGWLGPASRLAAAGALLCMASGLRADECPQFERTEDGVRLHVPAATFRALQGAAPGFRPWSLSDYAPEVRSRYTFTMRQAPWAVIGDFDGDGWCDLVVDGRSKTDSYRLCAWGSAAGPRVVTLGTRRLPPVLRPSSAALRYVPPGEVLERFRDKPVILFTDAFGEGASGDSTRVFYWKGGHFRERRSK
jgi:hypothetical protein